MYITIYVPKGHYCGTTIRPLITHVNEYMYKYIIVF